MEKGILFLTIAAGCLWIILDEFFGTKKISGVAQQMTPTINNPVADAIDGVTEGVKDFVSWDVGTKTRDETKKDASNLLKEVDKNTKLDSKVKDVLKDSISDFYNYYES